MKKYLVISLLCLLLNNLNLFSQNIIIKGKIQQPTANSQQPTALIRLMTYNDMLTREQTTIYETKADENGNFVIKAEIDKITPAQIAIDLERVDIILKPSAEYEVEITIPERDENLSYFERQYPTMKMIKTDDDGLYYQYYKVENIIDDFILDNFNQIYRRRQKSLLDSLDILVNKELGVIKYDFVKDYLLYRKANIQMAIDNDNAETVMSRYYDKHKILYTQSAYMSLFDEIFVNYLVNRQFEPSELMLNLRHGYDRFMSYVKSKDVFLSDNKELAELIVAWNMKRMYYEYPEERKFVLAIFEGIKQNTKVKDNKNVVENILTQINRLSYGTDAPHFSLKNADGKIVSLSSFKDNMLLLQFVNKVSPMTDYQFQELNNISQYWPDMIKIITIATDDSFDDFKAMIEKNGYNWELLKLSDNMLLLEQYQIKTFPDYIIVMPQNKIGMAPAPAPDQYLDYHMKRIYSYTIKK